MSFRKKLNDFIDLFRTPRTKFYRAPQRPPRNTVVTNATVRKVSGSVTSTSSLTLFFYFLLRDHLAAGEVEKIVMAMEESPPATNVIYSNGYLAAYARMLAARIHALDGPLVPMEMQKINEKLHEESEKEKEGKCLRT